MRSTPTGEVRMKKKELALFVENLLEQDTIYWAQRGKVSWLRRGDRNTTFFQHFALARRKRNLIKKLKEDSGSWVEGNEGFKHLTRDYFSSLFTSGSGDIDLGLLNSVKPSVTSYMNDILLAEYTREEVRKALFQIGDLKAPGPDGLHVIFFKRFWHIVGDELTDEVLHAVKNRKIP